MFGWVYDCGLAFLFMLLGLILLLKFFSCFDIIFLLSSVLRLFPVIFMILIWLLILAIQRLFGLLFIY
jgi:hypothetical protein